MRGANYSNTSAAPLGLDSLRINNMKFGIITIIVIVVVVGSFLLFSRGGDSPTTKDAEGNTLVNKIGRVDKAPDFRLKDYDGNEVSLGDFKGENIIVNSWAVWCPFCVKELKDFAELEHELGDDITIIAIDRAESLEKVKGYTDDLDVTHDIVFLLDPDDSFYRSIGGFTMPETLFVSGEGNILLHRRGPMTLEEMLQKSNELFKL